MAIKITDSIQTNKGATTGLYICICEYYRNKAGDKGQFPVMYYKDETKAEEVEIFDASLNDVISKSVYRVDISSTIGVEKIEKAAYDALGNALKDSGLTPQSDESGSWVNY